ncbi:suppressor of ascus dominance [Metarhizium rileyi]|uniref:RNA-dependent RNA polymerase n=1 Tax=Metarhizium rileyi (strain RCEF 4871) TaxID=1649241 RepID=A0A162JIZ7_METRR|nr:suppressor of ascus dominance [Metarhizium rileyi RCEF 4871]
MPAQISRPAPRQQRYHPQGKRGGRHIKESSAKSNTSFGFSNEWQTRPNVDIQVNNLPVDISAEYIWRWFASEGNIFWIDIDIFPPNSSRGTMSAKIRFQPPPPDMFWRRGIVRVQHPDTQQYPDGLTLTVLMVERPSCSRREDSRYQGRITTGLSSLAFGTMLNPSLMRVMKIIEPSRGLLLEVDIRKKTMTVQFSTTCRKSDGEFTKEWKVTFQISTINTILETTADDESPQWIFSLPYPPEYFGKVDNILDTFQGNPRKWYASDAWYRATNISSVSNDAMNQPVSMHDELQHDEDIDIGRWTTFCLTFGHNEVLHSASYGHLHTAFNDLNVILRPGYVFLDHTEAPSLWAFLEHPSAAYASQPSALLGLSPKISLPFQVRYQLEVCISRGIFNEYTIGIDFLERLNGLQPLDATRRLEYLVDQDSRLVDPMKLFGMEEAAAYVPTTKIPPYCTFVRKASITPTTIRFNSPTVETSNRVVRKYSHLQDRFLRVQFVEESELDRVGKNKQNNDEVWKRVERVLFQGIRIGDRQYTFLAFGSSQLRQSSAYFFCPTDHVSCQDIRAWMGHFDHIRCVAKYAARLGQCFSTTRDIRGIWMPNIKRIDDIERNGHCFTDGSGIISNFLSQVIIEEMTLDIFDKPTAFQFRMGGCKGVLAAWPQAQGMEVHIRNSQEKFKSDFQGLEIVRCAARSTATLNRQTITILESLGVPKEAFMRLLKSQIALFEKAEKDNSVAIELLSKFVDENQATLVLAELLKAGFKSEHIQEPFTLNLLHLWISWSFRLLKEKTRIHVPKSAFVLGCVDESGSLRGHSIETEGTSDKLVQRLPQIFLQLTDPNIPDETNVIRGVCIVGRNPSLHPGDIRVVQAIDEPKLRHLKDVVVFPSKGDRPVPAMLSGGDLDGDDFFVIWDQELIPREWNHKPMEYEAPSPRQLDRNIQVDDLREFFVNYMKNDVLPLIAVAHLAFADDLGVKSPTCLRLADLHSQAVDYAKTGEPAEFSSKMQPDRWPHFMENKGRKYRSKKALGGLYDEVIKHTFHFRPNWESSFDKRILETYKLDEDTLTAARTIKAQYDIAMRRLLVRHSVETEFELYTGWVMSSSKIASDYKRQEDLGREFDVLKQRFREQCCNVAGSSDAPQLDKFVVAMYKVTEEQVKAACNGSTRGKVGDEVIDSAQEPKPIMPFISFPWIFHWVMIRLAMGDKYKPGKSVLAAARRTVLFDRSRSTHHFQHVDVALATTLSDHGAHGNDKHGVVASSDIVGVSIDEQTVDKTEHGPIMRPEGITSEDKVSVQDEDDMEKNFPDSTLCGDVQVNGTSLDRVAALLGLGDD